METNDNTNTNANSSGKPHALVWIAGIAVTTFSLAGIAAIMGWIPTSMGKHDDTVIAKVEAPRSATTTRSRSEAPVAPRAKSTVAAAPAAAPAPFVKAVCADCGVIETVRTIDAKGEGSGVGAVGGAVVGGVVGNQIGHGTGKAVATVVGAVGGGFAGNEIEKYVKKNRSYEIVVRLENGTSRTFSQTAAPAWQTGDRVKILDGVLHSNS
jgi:outer membrane lipoprotein SlyB